MFAPQRDVGASAKFIPGRFFETFFAVGVTHFGVQGAIFLHELRFLSEQSRGQQARVRASAGESDDTRDQFQVFLTLFDTKK